MTTKVEAVESSPVSAAQSVQGVMQLVGAVGKTGRNTQQNYSFRGIDAVVNAVGPALREVGGFIIPTVLKVKRERGVSKNGTPTIDTFVRVRYEWFGSAGTDCVIATVEGEATDTSDKSTSKAMSVAYRTFLIQILCLPTGEPDPDEDHIERQGQPANPRQERIKSPKVAKGDWAKEIADANDEPSLRKVYDKVEAAKELGLAFPTSQRKYVVAIAKRFKLPEPPKDVTVAQLINVVRGALEEKPQPPADEHVDDWPTAEVPKEGAEQ